MVFFPLFRTAQQPTFHNTKNGTKQTTKTTWRKRGDRSRGRRSGGRRSGGRRSGQRRGEKLKDDQEDDEDEEDMQQSGRAKDIDKHQVGKEDEDEQNEPQNHYLRAAVESQNGRPSAA